MGGPKMQGRVTKFLRLLAQRVSNDEAWMSSSPLLLSSNLEVAIAKAVEELPEGSLRSTLQSDLPSYVGILLDELRAANPSLSAPAKTGDDDQTLVTSERSLESLLKLALGPVLRDADYASAVKAAVVATDREAWQVNGVSGSSNHLGREWRDAVVRLLHARSNPPLSLMWTFVSIEKGLIANGVVGDKKRGLDWSSSRISVARSLLLSLMKMTAGYINGLTAIVTLAPVVSFIFEAVVSASEVIGFLEESKRGDSGEGMGKSWRKVLQKLKELVREVLGFMVLCQRREKNFGGIPFGPPLVNLASESLLPQISISPSFPVVTKGMQKLPWSESADIARLADVVIAEVAVLQLMIEMVDWRSRLKKQNKGFDVGKHELEDKLKNMVVHSASALCESDMLLDLLLDAPLPLLHILDANEEATLRGVLFESVLVEPLNFGLLKKHRSRAILEGVPREDGVWLLKRLAVTRRAVAFFRSQNERSRAGTISAGLLTWHGLPQLGRWLSARKSIKELPSTTILQDSDALIGWLVNAKDDTFSAILKKATAMSKPNHVTGKPPGLATEAEVDPDVDIEDMFFVDTKGVVKGVEGAEVPGFEDAADRAFTLAADGMRGMGANILGTAKKSDIFFHTLERADLKRNREAAMGSDSEDWSSENEIKGKISSKMKRMKRKQGDRESIPGSPVDEEMRVEDLSE